MRLDDSGAEQMIEYVLLGACRAGRGANAENVIAERFSTRRGMELVIHAPFAEINKAWDFAAQTFLRGIQF
jgi:ATP-dependent Lhr-like helicase